MSLARFFDRTADALLLATGGADRDTLEKRLLSTPVALRAHDSVADDVARREGFMLAVNLASRLFPRLSISGPASLVETARSRAVSVNPTIDLVDPNEGMPTLAYESDAPERGVRTRSSGWNVAVDTDLRVGPAEPAAALAAGCLGIGELFRLVFADVLAHGRAQPEPHAWNLVTLGDTRDDLPLIENLDVGRVHLAGCGAIGQAAVATLAVSSVTGELVAVDPETIELSNLQRYVLTDDNSVDGAKVDIIEGVLGSTALDVVARREPWSADLAQQAQTVLVAVDSGKDRIGVQGGLPGAVYNAYTGERDLGWSRHERFGEQPCLACLYWPTGPSLSRTRLVADALGVPEVRVQLYYAANVPVGRPLPPGYFSGRGVTPEVVSQWTRRSLLDDIAERANLSEDDARALEQMAIDTFYRQAVCGGALNLVDTEQRGQHVEVPLAHQSAMAGIMLATQLLTARHEQLQALRPRPVEGRLNMLREPAPYASPRSVTPGCICQDPDFAHQHSARWV